MNKKIIVSLSIVAAVAAVAVGATTAFFSDTETSTGNTFTAGAIDLKVDSDCHYYNITSLDNGNPVYTDVGCTDPDGNGPVVMGNWSETDLQDGVHKFFSFSDLKPGDKGEDTISLHVYDNDAWGKISMDLGDDLDNSCTEPEEESSDDCTVLIPNVNQGDGELLEAMLPFSMWLDQGAIPGFQNVNADGDPIDLDPDEGFRAPDPTEGDNVRQDGEPSMPVQGDLELSGVLADAYDKDCDDVGSVDGHNNYGLCQGLAEDGRMVGSTTYYFGLAWELPLGTGNEVQTDSLSGDIAFEVEQHRNNPDPFAP